MAHQILDPSGNLRIFENFEVDRSLPKHQPQYDANSIMMRNSGVITFGDSDGVDEGEFMMRFTRGEKSPSQKPTLMQKFASWFRKPTPAPEATMSVQEFFASVKNSKEELVVVEGRAKGYADAVIKAKRTGQKALQERLEGGLEAVRGETQLIALGVTRVLPEAVLVDFVRQSPKGLRLDWVRNFTRMIPDDLVDIKAKCDERLIFDNYVVLHYDPDGKSWAETQEEKERRKDPILFGVIREKRQLYFIGEWVDEFCDLSLDQIADVLSKDSATEELKQDAYV